METDGGQKTSVDGLYAAGDVCVKNLRQVVTAVGDGALAATELERYAARMQKLTGLKPQRAEPAGQKASGIPKKENAERSHQDNALFDPDTAEVYDINHFGDKKQKYNVMSVPCLVINEDQVVFGKKNLEQILDLL